MYINIYEQKVLGENYIRIFVIFYSFFKYLTLY